MLLGIKRRCPCQWTPGFFGLSPNHRQLVHSQLFDLIYHGNGGFNWNDVYNMPIWARRFYTNKIIEFKNEEKKAYEKSVNKTKGGIRK